MMDDTLKHLAFTPPNQFAVGWVLIFGLVSCNLSSFFYWCTVMTTYRAVIRIHLQASNARLHHIFELVNFSKLLTMLVLVYSNLVKNNLYTIEYRTVVLKLWVLSEALVGKNYETWTILVQWPFVASGIAYIQIGRNKCVWPKYASWLNVMSRNTLLARSTVHKTTITYGRGHSLEVGCRLATQKTRFRFLDPNTENFY